ncbi:AAA family ATPase [Sporosarcina siberiensis]|uniref:AAA family ATPase n=1 Tax=Sporosarcina siberiensis TaxID=1365606 RepID=A0ABW4SF12_9BACL
MTRFVIITVGKTHSGKTTFAKSLEKRMSNSIVIDQDNHAEFLHAFYPGLLPKDGQNTIKHDLTQTIVQHAVNKTDGNIILCNSNRTRNGRLKLLDFYRVNGFTSILVYFDIPTHILEERISKSQRSTLILRTVSTFEEVLTRQENEDKTKVEQVNTPEKDEADYLFVVRNEIEVQSIMNQIITITER